jgi:hypothetical protein
MDQLKKQLAECQAQNAKLAERVVGVGEIAINSVSRQALAECQAQVKQAKREALLEAAERFNYMGTFRVRDELRRMAHELQS